MTTTSSPPPGPAGQHDDTQPLPAADAHRFAMPSARHTATHTPIPPSVPESPGGPARPLTGRGLAGSLWRRWLVGWGSVAHLLLNLPLGALWLVVPILLPVGLFTIPAAGVGILIIVIAIWIAAAIAWVERHRVRALLGADVEGARTEPGMPWWQRVTLDPVRWRETGGVALQSLWGLISGGLTVWVLGHAFAVLVSPLQWGYISRYGLRLVDQDFGLLGGLTGLGEITTVWGLAIAWVLALLVVLVAPLVASWVTLVDVHLARWLFAEDPNRRMRQLENRAADLDRTRTETVDSVEAERRRIERDLHDGPQQRLVAIAMDLGMARTTVGTDPSATADLLDKAHASAKEAIIEMRQVARGIVPPVLADRGLDAALSALAARTPVPVEVSVDPRVGRLEASVEAIAYFCVSEALTNVAKHSRATRARVGVTPADDGTPRVSVTISDDGMGGARVLAADQHGPAADEHGPAAHLPTTGTGLAGLRQRVAAVDGEVHVYSPAGGPTVLTVLLPWRRAGQAPEGAPVDPYATPDHGPMGDAPYGGPR